MPNRRRRILGRVALVVAGPLAFLLLLECVARVALAWNGESLGRQMFALDRELGLRLLPGYVAVDPLGNEIRVNSMGLRNAEVETPKPAGRFRVLAVGDSVTYGFHVAAEQTFASRLEVELESRGWRDVEVVNAGVEGYSTYQGLVFMRRLLALEPDLIVFSCMNNDRWESLGEEHSAEHFASDYSRAVWRDAIYHGSAFGRMIVRWRSGGFEALLPPIDAEPVRNPLAERERAPRFVPKRLAAEPVSASDPRVREIVSGPEIATTVSLRRREVLIREIIADARAANVRLAFLNLYDNPYHCGPLRSAVRQLENSSLEDARRSIMEYVTTPAIPSTSAANLVSYDVPANAMLHRIYESLAIPAEKRRHFFPRSRRPRRIVHLDLVLNRQVTAIAAEQGSEVVDFENLEMEDYIDSVHLSPRGHQAVAVRLADWLGAQR